MLLDILAVSLGVIVAFLLIYSGFAKLGSVDDFRESVQGSGVLGIRLSPIIASVISYAVPISEVLLGALLLSGMSAFAAIGVCLLMVLFSLHILVEIAKGNTGECNCFGAAAKSSYSTTSVLRNMAIAGATAFYLLQFLDRTPSIFLNSGIVAALVATMCVISVTVIPGFVQSNQEFRSDIPLGPSVGDRLDEEALALLPSEFTSNANVQNGRTVGILFTSDHCMACETVEEFLAANPVSGVIRVKETNGDPSPPDEPALVPIPSRGLLEIFNIRATPSLVEINPSGQVMRELLVGTDDVLRYLKRAT